MKEEEIKLKRLELDSLIEKGNYKGASSFIGALRDEECKQVLCGNDTALDLLFELYVSRLSAEDEAKRILYIIAKFIEISGYQAKFKFNNRIMQFYNLVTDDEKDPSKVTIKQAIKMQGGDVIAFYADIISRIGNVLGIETKVRFMSGNEQIYEQSSQGSYFHVVLGWFAGMIRKYREEQAISSASKPLIERFERALANGDDELKIIPSGCDGHAIYIATFGDHLILSNRGHRYSDDSGGIKIFKLKPGVEPLLKNQYATAKEFEDALATLVDLKNPEKTFFEVKPQRHGNCGFANLKGLITPYLYLCLPDEQKENAHNIYKLLSNWMRNEEVNRLIVEFNAAIKSGEEDKEAFYAGVLMRYIVKPIWFEPRSTFKAENDVNRTMAALNALDNAGKYSKFIELYMAATKAKIAEYNAKIYGKPEAEIKQAKELKDKEISALLAYFKEHLIKVNVKPAAITKSLRM